MNIFTCPFSTEALSVSCWKACRMWVGPVKSSLSCLMNNVYRSCCPTAVLTRPYLHSLASAHITHSNQAIIIVLLFSSSLPLLHKLFPTVHQQLSFITELDGWRSGLRSEAGLAQMEGNILNMKSTKVLCCVCVVFTFLHSCTTTTM